MAESNGCFYFDNENQLSMGKEFKLKNFISMFIDHANSDDSSQLEATRYDADTSTHRLIPYESRLETPLFVYSKQRLVHNLSTYKQALKQCITNPYGIETNVSYAVKANFNPTILKLFHQLNSWCSLVNKNELQLALRVGFRGSQLIFNGNGKTLSEIEMAINANCYLNVDSMFNLEQTVDVCKRLQAQQNTAGNKWQPVKLIIRVNEVVNVDVHEYLETSYKFSKFGIMETRLAEIIDLIKQNENLVELAGVHVHLGSTIKSISSYEKAIDLLVSLFERLKPTNESLRLLNFGGGLGIDYEKYANRTSSNEQSEALSIPSSMDLANAIAKRVKNLNYSNLVVVVEPGRSLVADSAVILTKLLGVKRTDFKNFLVVDASMCECIRPCLYSAYHHVDYVESYGGQKELVDIVGPVCESADFLGKNRLMNVVDSISDSSNIYLTVMDVGAYCMAMASNYNTHLRPAEVLVDEDETTGSTSYTLIKHSETLDDVLKTYMF